MCGIVGAVGSGQEAIVDSETLDRMCKVLRHRGPDDQGVYESPPAALGMRRLSIIDVEGGHQPIQNEDGTVWLVFNGEIYNFKELRAELEALGHVFRSSSDSECIVHSYEEYGESCFARLRGMFAVAIWDSRNRTLLLARDRLGQKPLFYSESGVGMAFASELKALLEIPWLHRDVSREAVWDYLLLGYVPAPGSIFRGVAKLLPGHYLTYRNGTARTVRYWELPFVPKWTDSEDALGERLLDLLDESVRLRLVSDVPFGAFLSGGLDSSIVVSLMARHLAQPVKTFTIGFEEEHFSELAGARVVAQHVGSDHHELVARPDAVDILRDLVWHFDEPFGDSSGIPTFLVARLAAKHVKMVLSGDGGDELFGGYGRYQRYRAVRVLQSLPLGAGSSMLRLLSPILPARLSTRARWLAHRVSLAYPEDYLSGVALATPQLARELLGGALRDPPFAAIQDDFLVADGGFGLDRAMAGDIRTYLANDILVKVDRMTMAHSLEARAPLLDHKLVEFAARLPISQKLGPLSGKRLLKRVARQLLPQSSLQKKKHGFAIPLSEWFRGDLKPLLFDTLTARQFQTRGLFDAATAMSCAERHVAGTHDYAELLWLILTFELWAQRFIDGADA